MKLEIDKVYRARNGTEWKVVCIDVFNKSTVINKQQDNSHFLSSSGKFRGILNECDEDLIELVGDDFTPRPTAETIYLKDKTFSFWEF